MIEIVKRSGSRGYSAQNAGETVYKEEAKNEGTCSHL